MNMFGELIYSYTRAQAIEDGVLIDVSEMGQEVGFHFPIVITSAVQAIVEDIPPNYRGIESSGSRLKCVLNSAANAARSANNNQEQVLFSVELPHDSQNKVVLKLHIGPGDFFEPVLTIMLSSED